MTVDTYDIQQAGKKRKVTNVDAEEIDIVKGSGGLRGAKGVEVGSLIKR